MRLKEQAHAKKKSIRSKPYTIKRGLVVVGLVVIVVFGLVALVGGYSNDQLASSDTKAYAEGQNLVSVYYDGQKKTVATSATTVRDALQKMGVEVGKGDVVEPSLDHPLSQAVTNINVYRAYPYVIVDGNKKTQVLSGYRSPRTIIEQAGVKLYPEDIVTSERVDEFLNDGSIGEKLVIDRATPVTVVLAGKTFNLRTRKQTVGELFKEKGLDIRQGDVVKSSLDAKLTPGMTIVVSRLDQTITTEQQDIQPEVSYVTDETKPVGYSEVQDPGTPGKKQVTYTVTVEDGVEKARQVLQEATLVEPKPKIIVVGPTKPANGANTDGWAKLRQCESGGNYANKNNPLYRGAYQFSYSTWNNYGGYHDPADAPPDVQDAKALQSYASSGSHPWPICGRFLN